MGKGSDNWTEQRKEKIMEYLRNDPGIPTMTLARKMHRDCGDLSKSIESTRSAIRYIRGESGSEKRTYRNTTNKKRQVNTPIGNIVPKSDEPPEKVKPVDLRLNGYGALIGDIHFPYHSESALNAALEHIDKKEATDFILLNGDVMDFYQASRYSKNPKTRDLESEVEMVCDFLEGLTRHFGRVIYKLGNHERRWEAYLYANAPEIANMKCLSFESVFKSKELDIQIVRPQQVMHVGKYLNILHAHEFGGGCYNPVNPARGAFLRAQNNCIVSHHHQSSEHTSSDIRGNVTSAWSLGCLSELNPPFLPINKWNHGHATLHVEKNDFEVENHRIIKGKVR
jgi:hypothetical protein